MNKFKKLVKSLPSSIPVCGCLYSIEWYLRVIDTDGNELSGEVDSEAKVIKLSLHRPNEPFLKKTLLHEVIHAISYQNGWNSILEDISKNAHECNTIALEESLDLLVEFKTSFWDRRKIEKALKEYSKG